MRSFEGLVASSDEMRPSFLASDSESTVVGTVKIVWRKSVESAQRVCICIPQAANRLRIIEDSW